MVDSSVLWTIKVLAATTSLMMICSPSISIYRIHKKKDVGVASVIPLVSLLANGHMWMLYGYMVENWFPIFWIFVFGDIAALMFLTVYWRYTIERRYVARVLAIVSSILVVVTIYAIVGGLGYIVAVCLYGAPMEKLFHVLKHRSAIFINVHMVIAGLSNNCTWITYGILTTNWFIISPNILFISLNSFTLVLYMIFNPKTHPLPDNFHLTTAQEGAESVISIELTPKRSFTRKVSNDLPSPTSAAMRVVEILSAITSLALICSPAIVMYHIFQKKDVGVASVVPLATLLANAHMWMLYGYMIENWFPVFWVFLLGDAAGLLYLAIYWRYTPERRQVVRILGVTFMVLLLATLYAIVGDLGHTGQTRGQVGSTVGILCDIVAVCLYGAPMEKLFQVLKYRSAVFINVHMVMASLANNVMWFTYGELTDNWYIISPNILFITLNSSTLVLYLVFNPKTHPLPVDFNPHSTTEDSGVSMETSPKAAFNRKTSGNASSPGFEALKSPAENLPVNEGSLGICPDTHVWLIGDH
ncbi:Hypothetical protein PHPALM_2253 [Phytophthora palmivora]|uniref:MtN3-like protein n=1 Tax=Phytophthora palmivora TaxID=4796 RepID=A0A2P4YQ92_9STRA|nr:Hypothetical protein PHPALM_2253 [Phytophthora palmivora]